MWGGCEYFLFRQEVDDGIFSVFLQFWIHYCPLLVRRVVLDCLASWEWAGLNTHR